MVQFRKNSVTLNLFQGPSGLTNGASRKGANREVMLENQSTGCAVKWALKQVQGDDE